MVLAHVSRCFMTELVVDERRPAVSAESDDLAPAWAKFGGLSGKIRIMSWEQLGEEVRLRRKQLKLTQPDLAERGGLSVATIRAVETNRAGRLSRRLRRALERAIDWEAGSIDTVLEGGTPRVLGTSAAMGARAAPAGTDTAAAAAERFAMAQRLIKMRRVRRAPRGHDGERACCDARRVHSRGPRDRRGNRVDVAVARRSRSRRGDPHSGGAPR